MAYTKSRERRAVFLCKKEVTEGTDSVPAGGIDDLNSINSPNSVEQTVAMIKYRPHSASLTTPKDLTGVQVADINAQFWMMGSGSAGVSAVNGFRSINAIWEAAGAKNTVVAA